MFIGVNNFQVMKAFVVRLYTRYVQLKYLPVFICCLPLLFINMRNSHDWGGDFALYLQQAENIVHGVPQTENYYIYNPQYPMLGPSVYPVGFPLLLAPVYALFGHNFLVYNVYMSLLLLCAALFFFILLHRRFSYISSLLLLLLFVYNPWMIKFKTEIVSDLPFTMLMLAGLVFFVRGRNAIISGLIAGYIMMVRSIGVLFLLAACACFVYDFFYVKEKDHRIIIIRSVIRFLSAALLLNILVSHCIFHLPSAFKNYEQHLSFFPLWTNFLQGLSYYVDLARSYFLTYTSRYHFYPLIVSSAAVSLMLIGIVNRSARKLEFFDFVFVFYLGLILIYPYRLGGFRFLLPVYPLLLIYAAEGYKTIRWAYSFSSRYFSYPAIVLVLLLYIEPLWHIWCDRNNIIPGPHSQPVQEAFEYVRSKVPRQARIAFGKPRVMGFFTKRYCAINRPDQSVEEVEKLFSEYNIHYVITHADLSNSGLQAYIDKHRDSLSLLWENEKVRIFYLPDR